MDYDIVYKTSHSWGYIHWIRAHIELCVKELHFYKDGATSFHSHKVRNESLFILSGKFSIYVKDVESGYTDTQEFSTGMNVFILPNIMHQITAITEGTIIEITKGYDENDILRYK